MKTRAYLVASATIFAVVGIIHLVRFALGWSVQLGTWTVPLSTSLIAVVACAALALRGANLARRQ